jgi:hypothetical protein
VTSRIFKYGFDCCLRSLKRSSERTDWGIQLLLPNPVATTLPLSSQPLGNTPVKRTVSKNPPSRCGAIADGGVPHVRKHQNGYFLTFHFYPKTLLNSLERRISSYTFRVRTVSVFWEYYMPSGRPVFEAFACCGRRPFPTIRPDFGILPAGIPCISAKQKRHSNTPKPRLWWMRSAIGGKEACSTAADAQARIEL